MNIITVYEIVGLCVTLFSAVTAYVKSTDDAKKQNAVLVSLIGVIFTMLTAIRFDVLPGIEKHLAMEEVLTKNKDLLPLVEKVAAAQQVESSSHPLMTYMLKQRLQTLEDQFDKMSQGRFIVDQSEMPEFSLELIRSAKKRVLATSFVQPSRWWTTAWGRQYEDLNEKKVKSGVIITRVFILSSKADLDVLKELMNQQKRAGIDVQYAYSSDLQYKISSDMVVVDDNLGGELRLTPDKGMTFAEFVTRVDDISDIERRITAVSHEAVGFVADVTLHK